MYADTDATPLAITTQFITVATTDGTTDAAAIRSGRVSSVTL